MKVIYARSALRQLDEVLSYIEERNPQGAQNVKLRIHAMIDLLAQHPLIGTATDRRYQRRIFVNPYPYVIFYQVSDEAVTIQRIRHTARQPI